jgi:hypothetical protein
VFPCCTQSLQVLCNAKVKLPNHCFDLYSFFSTVQLGQTTYACTLVHYYKLPTLSELQCTIINLLLMYADLIRSQIIAHENHIQPTIILKYHTQNKTKPCIMNHQPQESSRYQYELYANNMNAVHSS